MLPRRRALFVAALAACVLTSSDALAQKLELVAVSGQYMPGARVAASGGAKAQVSSYEVSLNVPLPLGPSTFLVPGLGYHEDSVSFSETPPGFIDLKAFHAIDVPFLFVQLLPDRWSVSVRIAPGIAGDLQALDGGLLRLGGLAMASHAFSKKFVLGGGGLASFAFGTLLPLPAVYLDWRPLDGFAVEGFLPAFLDVHYTIADRVRVGLHAEFAGNQYAVRDARIRSSGACSAQRAADTSSAVDESTGRPSECFDNLAYSVGAAGPSLGVRLVSTLWLTGMVGHTFYRRFDQRSANGDLLVDGSVDIPNDLVVRAGLVWRVPGQ